MTRKELVTALQQHDESKTVLVQHGSIKTSACNVVEVLYCKALRDGYDGSDICVIGHDAGSKKCSSCKFNKYDQCEQMNGIGQYMVPALLIVGESPSMPSSGSGSSGRKYDMSNFASRQKALEREDDL